MELFFVNYTAKAVDFADYADFMEKETEKCKLDDFYIPQKVSAFCRSYVSCATEREADEVFTDDKLRRYFQAYPVPGVGDLLLPYLDALEEEGFHLCTSVIGEPAIFVCTNIGIDSTPLLPGLTDLREVEETSPLDDASS